MSEHLSKLLLKNQNKKFSYKKTQEYNFFKKNRNLLKKNKSSFIVYYQIDNTFQLLCANIIIHSTLNKAYIDKVCKDLFSSIFLKNKLTKEDFLKYYHARIIDLKYVENEQSKVYLPFFSIMTNEIYYNDPFKLMESPYSSLFENYNSFFIDLFDVYNIDLFNSYFTKLVKIKDYPHRTAFYHFDTNTILIINDQGRLDYSFALFDKYMDKIDTNHIIERTIPICDGYMDCDKTFIIKQLFEQRLISETFKNKLMTYYANKK